MEGLIFTLSGSEIVVGMQTGLKQRPGECEQKAFKTFIERAIPFKSTLTNERVTPNLKGENSGKWLILMTLNPTNTCPRKAIQLLRENKFEEQKG